MISRQFRSSRGVCGFASLVQSKSLWLERKCGRGLNTGYPWITEFNLPSRVCFTGIAGSVVSGVILLLLFDAWKRIGGPLIYVPVSYHELPRSAVMINAIGSGSTHLLFMYDFEASVTALTLNFSHHACRFNSVQLQRPRKSERGKVSP